jgi:chemotaxis protein histidine kinase CheA
MPNDQKRKSVEIFMPPNTLKAKVGGTVVGIDVAAIRRAEAAVSSIKKEFSDWLAEDINNLNKAYIEFLSLTTVDSFGKLFRASHDLKGQAATFEFPLVARIAASLCNLIETIGQPMEISRVLVNAHVEAIRAIHHSGTKDTSDLTALRLAEELEARVREATERAAAAKRS